MSVIIVGCNKKQGFIMADTMISNIQDGNLVSSHDERKIYTTKKLSLIFAGMNYLEISKNTMERIYESKEFNTQEFNKIYYEEMERFSIANPNFGNCAYLNRQFLLYRNESENVRVAIFSPNEQKHQFLLDNAVFVSSPGDTEHRDGILQNWAECIKIHDILNDCIKQFIKISEKSKYVSDTCCIATMNHHGIVNYYEDNMYRMQENIQSGCLKSDIAILAQSVPRFIDVGVQKPIP